MELQIQSSRRPIEKKSSTKDTCIQRDASMPRLINRGSDHLDYAFNYVSIASYDHIHSRNSQKTRSVVHYRHHNRWTFTLHYEPLNNEQYCLCRNEKDQITIKVIKDLFFYIITIQCHVTSIYSDFLNIYKLSSNCIILWDTSVYFMYESPDKLVQKL